MKTEWVINAGAIQGERAYQQDCVTHIRSADGNSAVAVLCDGVGGGAHGNIASQLVLERCLDSLRLHIDTFATDQTQIPKLLRRATEEANDYLAAKIEAYPGTAGMSTTLVAAVICEQHLYWSSVGDSQLCVYRGHLLKRLNDDHSLADGLNNLVKIGAMDAATAKASAKSSVLTSAISGAALADIHCPEDGFQLRPSDVVLLFSDGLETLETSMIEQICHREAESRPGRLCGCLLDAVADAAKPGQDNASVITAMAKQR